MFRLKIMHLLLELNQCPSISFLRASLNDAGYSHILSFRRQLYVTPEDFSHLPEKKSIHFDETTYWIYLSSDTMTCFVCKKDGHIAFKCTEAKVSVNISSGSGKNTVKNTEHFHSNAHTLQQNHRVSEETQELIEQIAREMLCDEDSDSSSKTCIEGTVVILYWYEAQENASS
ncbi:hypothetical protein ACJJTC_013130 [Scirpophaga incertulas]